MVWNQIDIKTRYGFSIIVEYEGKLPKIDGIEKVNDCGNYAELILERNANTQDILKNRICRLYFTPPQIELFQSSETGV